MKIKPFKRAPVLIALVVVLTVCLARLVRFDLLENIERMTYDMRVRKAARMNPPVAPDLGFVFMDEESIRAVRDGSVGYKYGMLWPREIYGRLIEELSEQGARAVALDVILAELRPDHPEVEMADGNLMLSDNFFAMQMRRASNVILAISRDSVPPDLFRTNAFALGDIAADPDADGILRRAQAFGTYRAWHPAFVKAEAEFGADLNHAIIKSGKLVIPIPHGQPVTVPLDTDGTFDVTAALGSDLPAGMARRAKPFAETRFWHMGIVLAAQKLGLDLSKAEIDLPHGRIILRNAAGLERVIPVDREGWFYIDWCIPPNHPRLAEEPIQNLLLQNRARLLGQESSLTNRWKDKLVVVGSAAVVGNNLTDRGATPLEKDTLLVSKHWNIANSILTGRFVRRASISWDMALIACLGFLAAFLTWQMRSITAFVSVVAVGFAYVALASAVYVRSRFWLPVVFPLGAGLLVNHVCQLVWRVVFEQAEKRHMRGVFSKIVSPKIVKVLLAEESLSIVNGARREITVLFADVRGFTELTDTSQERIAEYVRAHGWTGERAEACFDEQARETLATVNAYLGLVADIVIKQDGTLDKYIGDCVMAFWGAPTSNPKHASACVRAAIEAQRAIEKLNGKRAEENKSRELENLARKSAGLPPKDMLPLLTLGSGINSGMAIVGLMGSQHEQQNYTVFGREVNLASRLEGLSGRGRIFISQATHDRLRGEDPDLAATCISRPPEKVKGISSAVAVYEVPWREAELEPAPEPAAAPARPGASTAPAAA